MPRDQDEVGEQMKARLGNLELPQVKPVHWNTAMFPHRPRHHRRDPIGGVGGGGRDIELKTRGIRYTDEPYTGLNEHYNLEVEDDTHRRMQDIVQTPERGEDNLELSHYSQDESIVSNAICVPQNPGDLKHVCMETSNSDVACPLCIEMTLMASPFEIDREKLVYDPKKNLSAEHECGLNEKHFYYAETTTMASSPETRPLDEMRFESCEDLGLETGPFLFF